MATPRNACAVPATCAGASPTPVHPSIPPDLTPVSLAFARLTVLCAEKRPRGRRFNAARNQNAEALLASVRVRVTSTDQKGDRSCHASLCEEAGALFSGVLKPPSSQRAMQTGERARLAKLPLRFSDTLARSRHRDSLRAANTAQLGQARAGVSTRPGTAGHGVCSLPPPTSRPANLCTQRRGRLSLPPQ